MAVTESTYTGNGSQTNYAFTFPYLKQTDVKVSIGGVATTAWSFANATTVQFNSAPANSSAIRIYRDTDTDSPAATFYAGSAIKSEDLNDNFLQNLYTTQESKNKVDTGWQKGDETVISTETWYTTDDTKVASTKAIEGRVDAKIDTALTTDIAGGNRITVTDNSPGSGQVTLSVTPGSLLNIDVNASAAIAQSKLNIADATTSAAGYMSASDKTKLDGIETAATANQTNAEIRAAVEAATDSNVFTDADHTKLNNIETAATADQTNAEIRAAVEAASDSNVFTDADHTKLNGIETAATADQTAAEIKTAYESNAETNALTDAEKLVIDGVTANTSELNKLDGVTASTAELNIVAGKSFKTSSGTLDTTSDTEIPSSKVIAAHVASSQSAVGGFLTIADEGSFPNTPPSTGVAISINNAQGVVVSGSGVATNCSTVGNTAVTINNFPSSLNNETLAAGVGLVVTYSGSGQAYNYHKILVAESDVKQLSDDINDFNSRYRIASSEPGSSNDEGDLYFDTTANKMKVYNGSAWDDVASVGSFFINTISSSSGTGGGSATFNGSAYRFTLSNAGTAAQQHVVSVNGVIQKPNSGTSQPSEGFAIDGSDIIFSAAPASGADYFIITQGSSVSIGTPSANSVNSSHIIDGSITNADISNSAAIAESKLDITIPGGANGLDLNDDVKAQFGTGADLKIYHSGTGSYIQDSGTGKLYIGGSQVNITNADISESIAHFIPDGAVELFYDNSKKFETTSGGVKISGYLDTNDNNIVFGDSTDADTNRLTMGAASGGDLQIYHNGSKSYIKDAGTGSLNLNTNLFQLANAADSEVMIKATEDGAVELYYDNSKKFETTSGGVEITGALTVNGSAVGGGASFDATAQGAISTGDPLILETSGKVRKPVQLSASTGSWTEIATDHNGQDLSTDSAVYSPTANQTFLFYGKSNQQTGCKHIGISGTTITLTNASGPGYGHKKAKYHVPHYGDQKGKIGYIGPNSYSGDMKCRLGTVTGSSISWGSAGDPRGGSSTGSNGNGHGIVYAPNVDRWVTFWKEGASTYDAYYQMFEGDLYTAVGSQVKHVDRQTTDHTHYPPFNYRTFWNEAEQKIVIFAETAASANHNCIVYRIGTVSANSITWTPDVNGGNGWGTNPNWVSGAKLFDYTDGWDIEWIESLGKYVVCSHNNNSTVMKIGYFEHNTSGGLTQAGSWTNFISSSTYVGFKHRFKWSESAGKGMLFYKNGADSTHTYYCEITCNGSNNTFSFGTPTEISSDVMFDGTTAITDAGTGKFAMFGSDANQWDSDMHGFVKQLSASDLTDNFVGFSDGNYANDATATVLCVGNVSSNHSSLSPGSKYYVTGTGGLSTTPANPSVFAGTAVTPTTITVKH